MKAITLFLLLIVNAFSLAVPPDQKTLPIGFAEHERGLRLGRPMQSAGEETAPPRGEVRSLAEWEESEAVMTLWANPSLLREFAKRGSVKLLADSRAETEWWNDFLIRNGIPTAPFSYFTVPTDSIWIRDYGPWFILDGQRKFGIVDSTYNRPRPQDDVVPQYLAEVLGLPFFHTGLTHTGGNYYNDGFGNAFSSTLVYRENHLQKAAIDKRIHDYLGINRYTTSPLGVGATIEHIDTFGKLVSPNTWVFSDFPEGSRFKKDSDEMVAKLSKLKSAYGTPYKIHRLKMWPKSGGENYRAYLNAFISNRAIYFPAYGLPGGNDEGDRLAKQTFEKAMPGYEAVGVDAENTSWGDSVHCRNRNLLKKDTIFIFPVVKSFGADGKGPFRIEVEAVPSPGAEIEGEPTLHWSWNGKAMTPVTVGAIAKNFSYETVLPAQNEPGTLSFYVTAKDSSGKTKSAPQYAPTSQISFDVPVQP